MNTKQEHLKQESKSALVPIGKMIKLTNIMRKERVEELNMMDISINQACNNYNQSQHKIKISHYQNSDKRDISI